MNKFKCTLKADRAGMKKGTVIEVTTSLASCDAHNIADACEAKFGKKSRDASPPLAIGTSRKCNIKEQNKSAGVFRNTSTFFEFFPSYYYIIKV